MERETHTARFRRMARNYVRCLLWFLIFLGAGLLIALNADKSGTISNFIQKWTAPNAPRLVL